MFYSLVLEIQKKGKFGSRGYIDPAYDHNAPNSQGELEKDEFPDFAPNFSDLILTKSSIEANFIYDGGAIRGMGYIVDKKVMNLLADFNLPPHRFYPLPYLRQKDGKVTKVHDQYFWLQILLENNLDWIDYKTSRFRIEPRYEGEIRDIKVNNADDLKEKIQIADESSADVVYDPLCLDAQKYNAKTYDLFYFEELSYYPYITQRLKSRLEAEKITGLEPISERTNVCLN